ncbi:Asp23/Gls24 family envelope stress response protein [Haloplasma contractile]|uniref:Alkaline-shock protein n=1 Tax=Haloplasma contractile SSD-17B TaxID=1033810 RepID=U2EFJ7_9MOLU|nr:Asp23/Gls24 family envelope stress response protein [Haloplasma contractile]ERJ13431.1 Putative alkaline-shock protein [Haloplasma contractile SSD-17B]
MTIHIESDLGRIDVSTDAIAQIAGTAATECYGVVGMASNNQLKDGLAVILRRENFGKGVSIRNDHDVIDIDLYVVMGYGVKISEVSLEIQKKVKYDVEQYFGKKVRTVNVYVQGVRVIDRN